MTSTSPSPTGAPGSWSLAFDDEFNGNTLDRSKWSTCYSWFNAATGCTNAGNNELEWYLPDGVSVSDGSLKLTAQRRTVTGTNGKSYSYTSGMISSGPGQGLPARFAYQTGFIEARMKLPAGKGMWPAFWTLPTDQSWPPEVDGMEGWGVPNQISMNVHWNNGAGHQQDMSFFTGPDFTADWHTVGVAWTATSMTWYVDGTAVKSFTNNAGVPIKPMYLILNLAINGSSAPDGSTPFPAVMEVDYVRAWKG
ncbi:MAG TPA: glycoside hydrolase family 16 protein [Chloroflexota bacterium]